MGFVDFSYVCIRCCIGIKWVLEEIGVMVGWSVVKVCCCG